MPAYSKSAIDKLLTEPGFAPLHRSLAVYYGSPEHDAAMDILYGRFVRPGALTFDIGSHVGDRIGCFRRLGARVVALEPQPLCAQAIRTLYADDPGVTLVEAACSDYAGKLTLRINSANPTVSTASAAFIGAADGAGGWEGQTWDAQVDVMCTTLDVLLSQYGLPAFTKIDVEGLEDAVLAGLSQALPALSFELTTIQRDVAFRCLERLASLGRYGFDIALGESQTLTFGRWLSKAEMAAHISTLR